MIMLPSGFSDVVDTRQAAVSWDVRSEVEIASEHKSFGNFVYDKLEIGSKRGFFRDEQGQDNKMIKL